MAKPVKAKGVTELISKFGLLPETRNLNPEPSSYLLRPEPSTLSLGPQIFKSNSLHPEPLFGSETINHLP